MTREEPIRNREARQSQTKIVACPSGENASWTRKIDRRSLFETDPKESGARYIIWFSACQSRHVTSSRSAQKIGNVSCIILYSSLMPRHRDAESAHECRWRMRTMRSRLLCLVVMLRRPSQRTAVARLCNSSRLLRGIHKRTLCRSGTRKDA